MCRVCVTALCCIFSAAPRQVTHHAEEEAGLGRMDGHTELAPGKPGLETQSACFQAPPRDRKINARMGYDLRPREESCVRRAGVSRVAAWPLEHRRELFWENQHPQPLSVQRIQVCPHPDPDKMSKGEMLQGQGPTQSLALSVTGQRKQRGSGKEKKDGEMQEGLCSTHNRVWASPDKCIQT